MSALPPPAQAPTPLFNGRTGTIIAMMTFVLSGLGTVAGVSLMLGSERQRISVIEKAVEKSAPIDVRVTRLEANMAHISESLNEIKRDVREIKADLSRREGR